MPPPLAYDFDLKFDEAEIRSGALSHSLPVLALFQVVAPSALSLLAAREPLLGFDHGTGCIFPGPGLLRMGLQPPEQQHSSASTSIYPGRLLVDALAGMSMDAWLRNKSSAFREEQRERLVREDEMLHGAAEFSVDESKNQFTYSPAALDSVWFQSTSLIFWPF